MMELLSIPVLAFGFASPWLLWGLALGSIPVIIHLLHKRKYRETDWAAMRFLLEAARKNSRRIRLEQLILLIVRMLILLLAALALARPYAASFSSYFRTEAPRHRIIVIDASFSMGFTPVASSNFERAKDVARQIVDSTRQGDALNLVRISRLLPRAVVRQPAFRKSLVADEIEQLKLTDEPGDLLATLESVEELLREAPEITRKDVYLISDFQRINWKSEQGGYNARLRGLTRRISDVATLTLIDLGSPQAANVAITGFAPVDPFVSVGREAEFKATFENFSETKLSNQLVKLNVDDKLVQTRVVNLDSNGVTEVRFSVNFQTSGEHQMELRLESDLLSIDDRRRLALPVRDELRILLVNGKPSGTDADNATHYLQTVLAPSTSRETWRGLTHPSVITEGELSNYDLSRFDCIFLCNVALFTDGEARRLRAYAESGGGLVFCMGDQVRAENYNNTLYQDGRGILPARLMNRANKRADKENPFQFDPSNLDHPIVSVFKGNPGTGLESTIVFDYLRAGTSADGLSRVVLNYDSGDPAIIEMPVGRGRSILVTTSVDRQWGAWPVQRSFAPVIHEIVRFASEGRWSQRQLLVGDPLTRIFPVRGFATQVSVTRPDTSKQAAQLSDTNGVPELRYDATDQSGIYRVEFSHSANPAELFAVNVDTRESNLAKVDRNELENNVLEGTEFTYHTDWQKTSREGGSVESASEKLGWFLLLAVLGLLFVEPLMAWRFSYGIVLLAILMGAVCIWQTLLWNRLIGWTLLLLLAAAMVAGIAYVRRRRQGTSVSIPQ